MYDPKCKAIFAVYPKACKYITNKGCSIYESPDKPNVCGEYMCPYPEETMLVKGPELIAKTEKILEKKWGKR